MNKDALWNVWRGMQSPRIEQKRGQRRPETGRIIQESCNRHVTAAILCPTGSVYRQSQGSVVRDESRMLSTLFESS